MEIVGPILICGSAGHKVSSCSAPVRGRRSDRWRMCSGPPVRDAAGIGDDLDLPALTGSPQVVGLTELAHAFFVVNEKDPIPEGTGGVVDETRRKVARVMGWPSVLSGGIGKVIPRHVDTQGRYIEAAVPSILVGPCTARRQCAAKT
jgi:hypothetical protein